MKISILQKKVLLWFRQNKRPLPWRGGKGWYEIWISEVMLQQTQVDTVIPYYHRFLKRFKTVKDLADASQQEVLKLWEGLGYYSRARNLHQAARIIVSRYNSQLPIDRETLLNIPGFGPYTTNAVLSIAFNQPYAVMDGNVKRIIARLNAIEEDIRDVKTQNKVQSLMDRLLPQKNAGEFNEAIMEIGATICKPSSPLCKICPVSTECLALRKNLIEKLPYKSPRQRIPTRSSLACIITHQDQYLIAKRPQHEMLAGLWEFPVLRSNTGRNTIQRDLDLIRKQFNLRTSFVRSWTAVKHTYTHFHFMLHSKLFKAISHEFQSEFYDDFQWLTIEKIKKLPLHKAVWKVLERVESELITISQ
jgi:A/G-specific adenine glycosylase